MQLFVHITNGHYRGETINGVFPVIKFWQEGTRGGFVTVRNVNHKPGHPDVQRISVPRASCVFKDADGNEVNDIEAKTPKTADSTDVVSTMDFDKSYEDIYTSTESEEQAMERIKHTFGLLSRAVAGCANGDMRGLIVSGPAGIGKSTGVVMQLTESKQNQELIGDNLEFQVVSGKVSDIGLYQLLYNHANENQVLVFDDCDDIILDESCLGIMKRALDRDNRAISWLRESRVLKEEGMDDSFEYNGTVIVLSNIDFERTIERGSRLADHLKAIMSRCHYFDLEMNSQRDQVLRVKQMVLYGNLLGDMEIDDDGKHAILDFIVENKDHLREISLRMAKKIADLYVSDPIGWVEMAEMTVLKRDAKFKRLLNRRAKAESTEVSVETVTVA